MPSASGVLWRKVGPFSSMLWRPKPDNFDGKAAYLQPWCGDKSKCFKRRLPVILKLRLWWRNLKTRQDVGPFPAVFVGNQKRYFTLNSDAFINLTIVVFVLKPKPSISTALWQEIHIKLDLKNRKCSVWTHLRLILHLFWRLCRVECCRQDGTSHCISVFSLDLTFRVQHQFGLIYL